MLWNVPSSKLAARVAAVTKAREPAPEPIARPEERAQAAHAWHDLLDAKEIEISQLRALLFRGLQISTGAVLDVDARLSFERDARDVLRS